MNDCVKRLRSGRGRSPSGTKRSADEPRSYTFARPRILYENSARVTARGTVRRMCDRGTILAPFSRMRSTSKLSIEGTVRPGFEAVRDEFIENFRSRGELGAACCIYQDGESVVDLWGGVRDRESAEPWRADTMVLVHSATKGMAAMALALAHSRGWLDYDARVCSYWPEFAGFYVDANRRVVRELEVPSGGGVGSARAIGKAYGVFAAGGRELGLRPETLQALMAPASPARHGFFDECFRGPVKFSLGFMRPSESFFFGHEGAFGAPGAGGAMGYADPSLRLGYGYVTNQMGVNLQGDARDVALRNAIPVRARGAETVPSSILDSHSTAEL